MKKPIIVSGIQPTGNLHLGNYLGAVKNWVELQNSGKYEMYIFIADLHSLTGNMTPEKRRQQIMETSAELISAGIDPKKTTLFVQSDIQEHAELAWIFNCVTPVGELKRMTQFKDKSGLAQLREQFPELIGRVRARVIDEAKETQEALVANANDQFDNIYENLESRINTGLLTYPVLQAADILMYKGELVPVGQDQIQHIELTRVVARKFNQTYGEYFPDTKHLLTAVPKVMSLLEPAKKMSKSLGDGHVIELGDDPEMIEKKLKRAVTATEGGVEAPGVENLLLLLKHFSVSDGSALGGSDENIYNTFVKAEKDKTIRYGDLKAELAKAISNYFANFRTKKKALLSNPKKLQTILTAGAKKARPVAIKTMKDVRKLVGLK